MNESDKSPSTPPLSGSDYLADIIKSIGSGEVLRKDSPPQESAPMQDIFSSLLSNPELLSKLPTIIATVKPIMEIFTSGNLGASAPSGTFVSPPHANTGEHEKAQALSTIRPAHKGDDHRSALLCALKPYLCEDRRRAIDYVIKLDRLGDVLKSL